MRNNGHVVVNILGFRGSVQMPRFLCGTGKLRALCDMTGQETPGSQT